LHLQPIVTVDLSSGRTGEYFVPREWEEVYLGGASLAARLLYDTLTAELDPLSPQAPLLFLTGPLTGTAGPAVGRFVVCGKSPATGQWAESNCGGFWGPELRFAGYDGVWVTGQAEGPIYIWICTGQVEVRQAEHLWGLDTYETQIAIKQELGQPGARVAAIGLAGQNQVLFASIACDHGRMAGRTGLGAVMGAKHLKAIAVRGNGKLPLARPEEFARLRSDSNHALKADTVSRVAHDLGTSGVVNYADYMGGMPKKYYQQGTFEHVDKISGSNMAETILVGVSACHACVIACGRVVRLEDEEKRKGPEYETIVGFGPNLLIDDLAAITHLGELCDRYGLDTISTSNTIGLAYKLFEDGVLAPSNADGQELHWGDAAAAERLIHQIAHRQGLGDLLAEGSFRFAHHFGVEQQAVQVNGLEVAYHDPRGTSGMALVYATSPRGACHNKSDYFFVDWGQADPELGLEFLDRQAGAEKAANVARHQDFRTLCDSLVLCLFANVPAEMIVALINAACGLEWNVETMIQAGERGWNLKRAINHRLGLTRADDKLPKALLEPLSDGNASGYIIPFDEMLEAYYVARGWDPGSGRPSREKLLSLGLGEIASALWGSKRPHSRN
jgi:aldehyde:ferredoxin oxidoreductase